MAETAMKKRVEVMLDPTHSESLFEPVGKFDPSKIGNVVECKACATTVASTEPCIRRHADASRRLSDGSTGTCADFWRATHDA